MNKNFSVDPYENSKVIRKIDNEFLVINKSKISYDLKSFIEKYSEKNCWIAPLSLFVTIIAALITATFTDKGLKKEVWEAIFVLSAVATFIWSIYCFNKLRNIEKLDDFITKLFNEDKAIKVPVFIPPKVLSTYPNNNSELTVSEKGEDIEFFVEYDQEMDISGYSWCTTNLPFPEKDDSIQASWDSTRRKCSLKMKIYPEKEYGISFNIPGKYEGFRSITGIPAEVYNLRFKTKKAV